MWNLVNQKWVARRAALARETTDEFDARMTRNCLIVAGCFLMILAIGDVFSR